MKFKKLIPDEVQTFSSYKECYERLLYSNGFHFVYMIDYLDGQRIHKEINEIKIHLGLKNMRFVDNLFTGVPINVKDLIGVIPEDVEKAVKVLKNFIKEGVESGWIKIEENHVQRK